MKDIPTKSINSCVTSPAYWMLRDYEVEGQMGLEPSPQEYINRLVRVFDEIFRVLRDDGTCWIVLGDTYYGRNRSGTPKSLALIPLRFAIAMTDRGWILRNRIIWHKPGATPASVKDRFTVDYEEMFFFTKSKRYYFEQQFVTLDPETEGRIERFIRNGERFDPARHKSYDRQGGMTMMDRLAHKVSNGEAIAANMRTVWTIPTARCTDAHFAVYPEELIRTPILAGCPKGGIVLDPFCGAGTTAIVCEMLGRSFLGIELNPAYVEIAKKRIRAARETIADEAATKGSGGISHEPKPQGTRGKRNHPSDKYPNDDWGKAADWDQTPEEVCRKIIGLITWAEGEFVLEPFRGDGNFYRNLPAWVRKDWCEIKEERDFFEYTGPSPDTIITNPPYRDKAGGENLVVPCLERCLQLARKRVIYFVNHKVFNALTATRMKKYGEWNWGITHLSVWDMKKWPGRYYLIIWEKDKPSIIDYSLATKSEGAADGK